MLRAIGCIAQEHDLRLVALAVLVCILATNTSLRLLRRGAGRQAGHATAWISGAAMAFSCGVWTTHFLGMLAFAPIFSTTTDVPLAAFSLALVAVPTQIGFAIWARQPTCPRLPVARPVSWQSISDQWASRRMDRWATAIATGLLLDAGIAMMHFIGMRALRMSAFIHYDRGLVIVALAIGGVLSVAAVRTLDRERVAPAALLLTLAMVAVHAVGIGAMTLEPVVNTTVTPLAISKATLAIMMGGVCLLILAMALLAYRVDRYMSARLAVEADRFRAMADATFEGLIFERCGRIIDTNRALCRLLGADPAMLVGRPIATVISGGVSMHPSTMERPTEYELIQQDGGMRPVEVLWRTGPDPNGHVLAVRDISLEKSTQLQIHRMTHFDALTGVGNRQLLEQTLQRTLTAPDRPTGGIALLCIDLDRFKAVNDSLGTRAGDAILVQAARRISTLVSTGDMVARVGGDEFAVIHPLPAQTSDAAALAERIVAQLGLPYDVDGQMIALGGSVGVALFPADGNTTLTLMTSAALALDRAKREGRNTWRYCDPGLDSQLRDRRVLESDLRRALIGGQLCLNYQPFFDAKTLKVAGYEALLRWDHPTRGRISPVDFIPIAEECGLIVPIGQWVLRTACAEAASWGHTLTIAVNLSPAQFGSDIVHMVDTVLRQTGLPPALLELEITEGVLIGDTDNALATLTALKALGVTLAMDDFGTGYSSLSYLKTFPFDKLKIDRSFIRDLEDDVDGEPIVQAILALSRSLRLEVTAEGVETSSQLVLLRAGGCTFIQGFLLGRPMTAQQVAVHGTGPAWPLLADEATNRLQAPRFRPPPVSMAEPGATDNVARQRSLDRLQAARLT